MKIEKCNPKMSFCANFKNTTEFKNVVDYAKRTHQLDKLDQALNRIKHVNPNYDILIIQGSQYDAVFSGFYCPQTRKSVRNIGASTPEEATFRGIIKLAELGPKAKNLFRNKLASDLTPEYIIDRYTNES